jgi:hypothetical protein
MYSPSFGYLSEAYFIVMKERYKLIQKINIVWNSRLFQCFMEPENVLLYLTKPEILFAYSKLILSKPIHFGLAIMRGQFR